MKFLKACCLSALVAGCGSEPDEPAEEPAGGEANNEHAGFPTVDSLGQSTPVDEGFTRYYSTVQDLGPGESLNLVEWVAAALDRDMDVVTVKGGQTLGGHHVNLAASANVEEIGSARDYDNADQLTGTLVGGAGEIGEGTSATELPEGYVFRVYEGQGFYLQTHYINATTDPIAVRSYIDVRLEEPSDERTVLTLFTHAALEAVVPPASHHTHRNECEIQQDLTLLMFANHMHDYGTTVTTTAILPDGTELVVKDDPVWNLDWQLEPNYTMRFDDPLSLPTGTILRTDCNWDNTSDKALPFPDEMCVFLGFGPSERELSCADGTWRVNVGAPTDTTPLTAIGDGACVAEDLSALAVVRNTCMGRPMQDVVGCALPLLEGNSQCIVDCFEENAVSAACGQCFGDFTVCNAAACAEPCGADPVGAECLACQDANCCDAFEACSGLSCG